MMKSTYQNRHSQGRCINCGKQTQMKPNGKYPLMCPNCAAKNAARQKERTRRLIEAGICPRCGAPLKDGESLCGACKAKDHEYQKSRHVEKVVRRAERNMQNREEICVKIGNRHYDGEEKYATIAPTEGDLNSIGIDAKENIDRCLNCEIPVEYCTGTNCVRAYRVWKYMEELKEETSGGKKE